MPILKKEVVVRYVRDFNKKIKNEISQSMCLSTKPCFNK